MKKSEIKEIMDKYGLNEIKTKPKEVIKCRAFIDENNLMCYLYDDKPSNRLIKMCFWFDGPLYVETGKCLFRDEKDLKYLYNKMKKYMKILKRKKK